MRRWRQRGRRCIRRSAFSEIAFESARLTFRTFTPADAADSYRHATARVTRFLSWEPYASPEAFALSWRAWAAQAAAGTDAHIVVRTHDGEFIGCCGVHYRNAAEPDVGLWIKEPAWGRGYGGEVVAALVDWVGREAGVAAVFYPVVDANTASRRIIERLGGVQVGERPRTKPRPTGETTVIYRLATRRPV